MSDNAIDRKRARLMARAAQALVVVLACAGVGAVIALPEANAGAEREDPLAGLEDAIAARMLEAAASEPVNTGPEPLPPDWESIAYAYHAATDIPFEDETAVVEGPGPDGPSAGGSDNGGTEGTPPPPPASASVRFLGRMTVGDRAVALVAVDGAQAFITEGTKKLVGSPGGTRVEVEVVRVEGNEIEIREDGTPFTVSMAERVASAVSMTPEADGASVPPAAGNARTNPRITAARRDRDRATQPLDREQFRKDDGTIDYEALRAAARARRDEIEANRIREASRQSGEDD